MHHYEEDLLEFVKQDSKKRQGYKEFKDCYLQFLSLAGIKEDKIDNVINRELLYYFNTEEGRIRLKFMFSYLEKSEVKLSVNSIKTYFLECYHSNYVKKVMNGLEGMEDVVKVADFFSRYEKSDLLVTFLEVIKIVLYLAGKQLIQLNDFKDKARKPFLKYYNNIINKKIISESLLSEITGYLSCDSYFDTQSDYLSNFIKYTKSHNDKVKSIREVKIRKEVKEPFNANNKKPVNVTSSAAKEETLSPSQDDEKKRLIDNYIDSYFEVLISCNTSCDLDSYLPPKGICWYDDVLKGLLLKYEEYLDHEASIGENTMDKMNLYMELTQKVISK